MSEANIVSMKCELIIIDNVGKVKAFKEMIEKTGPVESTFKVRIEPDSFNELGILKSIELHLDNNGQLVVAGA